MITLIHDRFWSKVDVRGPSECWPWNARLFYNGYGQFHFNRRPHGAHRIAWELDNGLNLKTEELVCHRCDNKPCCNPAHLFIGTQQDNVADRQAKNRQARGWALGKGGLKRQGEKNHCAKMTDCKVIELRAKYRRGEVSQTELGREFGINQTTVSLIVRGLKWKHLLNAD